MTSNVYYLNILLTGATGLIGQHILYELLFLYNKGQLQGKIFLLIRKKNQQDIRLRIRKILEHSFIPEFLQEFDIDKLLSFIEYIETDITSLDLEKKLNVLKGISNLYVIHSAASTNLFNNKKSEEEIYENNYLGTLKLLKAVSSFVKKFIYISTAFSCGIKSGVIKNNYLDSDNNENFRNPYEKYKDKTEKEINNYCCKNNIEMQILRPGVVCGRLIDQPLFYTSKFDVIYGWAKFFYKVKNRTDKIRIYINIESGLNILPVDYVAKVVVKASLSDYKELNIVHSSAILHTDYIKKIFKCIGEFNYEFIDVYPKNLNRLEQMYYKTVGAAFVPYQTEEKFEYDVSDLRKLVRDINEPNVQDEIENLINFAICNDFQAIEY